MSYEQMSFDTTAPEYADAMNKVRAAISDLEGRIKTVNDYTISNSKWAYGTMSMYHASLASAMKSVNAALQNFAKILPASGYKSAIEAANVMYNAASTVAAAAAMLVAWSGKIQDDLYRAAGEDQDTTPLEEMNDGFEETDEADPEDPDDGDNIDADIQAAEMAAEDMPDHEYDGI